MADAKIFLILETMDGAQLTERLAENSAAGWEVCGYHKTPLGVFSVLMQRNAPPPGPEGKVIPLSEL